MSTDKAAPRPARPQGSPSDGEIVRKLLSRIGTRVTYKYPNAEGHLRGVLTGREIFKGGFGPDGRVQYWNVVDRITFDERPEDPMVRTSYYRQLENGRLNFAGQTSSTHYRWEWAAMLPALHRALAGDDERAGKP